MSRDTPPIVRPIIVARDLGIRYPRPENLVTRLVRPAARRRVERWALRHLTFSVAPGDCVAVIGANGAGKSTLLQTICGLLKPDEGSIQARGRIASLLSLGVGFDPRLTGRQNIELLGALRGLSRREITTSMPDIVTFSELGDAIDDPIRTYSSGMRARLGFSAATVLKPDVLVLDEVLGTGDRKFRAKSQARLQELIGDSASVVMATHDLAWVRESATQALLLERGALVASGSPAAVVEAYRREH